MVTDFFGIFEFQKAQTVNSSAVDPIHWFGPHSQFLLDSVHNER